MGEQIMIEVFHLCEQCRGRNKYTESLIQEVKNFYQCFFQITARITSKSSKSNFIHLKLPLITVQTPQYNIGGSSVSNYINNCYQLICIKFILCLIKVSASFICSFKIENKSVRLVLSFLTLQIKKLEYREIKQLVKVHSGSKYSSQDTDQCLSDFRACTLYCDLFCTQEQGP